MRVNEFVGPQESIDIVLHWQNHEENEVAYIHDWDQEVPNHRKEVWKLGLVEVVEEEFDVIDLLLSEVERI